MVGPNLAHSRISLYRIFFVPDDTQTCFPQLQSAHARLRQRRLIYSDA